MAWLQVHQSLRNHRKTLSAARRLEISSVQLAGHLVFLWLWAIDNSPSGDLAGIEAEVLAEAAGWAGEAAAFLEALVAVDFLEGEPGAWAIHHWHDYTGRLLERREARAAAQWQRRYRPAEVPTATTALPGESEAKMKPPRGASEAALKPPRVEKTREDESTVPSLPPPVAECSAGACPPRSGTSEDGRQQEPAPSAVELGSAEPPRLAPAEFRLFWNLHPFTRGRGLTAREWDRQVGGGASPSAIVRGARGLGYLVSGGQYKGRKLWSEMFLRARAWESYQSLAPP